MAYSLPVLSLRYIAVFFKHIGIGEDDGETSRYRPHWSLYHPQSIDLHVSRNTDASPSVAPKEPPAAFGPPDSAITDTFLPGRGALVSGVCTPPRQTFFFNSAYTTLVSVAFPICPQTQLSLFRFSMDWSDQLEIRCIKSKYLWYILVMVCIHPVPSRAGIKASYNAFWVSIYFFLVRLNISWSHTHGLPSSFMAFYPNSPSCETNLKKSWKPEFSVNSPRGFSDLASWIFPEISINLPKYLNRTIMFA